ncbi:hypothetical protein MKX07_006335 [Trichoderma sp. CBMAI-0711]|nr:hypothetical protein MKX07_006335 [Trichoderma sp. CBMAI-0711]
MRSALLITAFVASSAMADYTTSSTVGDSDSAAAAITPEECAAKCSEAHDACATKPEANMAECASEFASCLGYNPFVNGDLVQPTACSPQAPSSSPSSSASSAGAAPWHTKSPSSPSHHHHEDEEDGEKDECKCYDEYNRCRAAPGANMSFCASNYAECLGYNPFDGSHDPEEVSSKCASSSGSSSKGGEGEKGEGHRPHRNETRPVQPTQPPVISGAASGVKALDVFGLLAAGIAALL